MAVITVDIFTQHNMLNIEMCVKMYAKHRSTGRLGQAQLSGVEPHLSTANLSVKNVPVDAMIALICIIFLEGGVLVKIVFLLLRK